MDNAGAPVGVRVDSMEMVVVIMVAVRRLAKLRMGQDGLTVDRVGTGDVERDGIERCEHADIRHDGGVVLGVAVAVRGDVADDRDMDARAAIDTSAELSVLKNRMTMDGMVNDFDSTPSSSNVLKQAEANRAEAELKTLEDDLLELRAELTVLGAESAGSVPPWRH